MESDWLTYFGSNDVLKAEVAELGDSKFKREILKFCYSKSECNYEETRLIFEHRAIMSDNYYNNWVSCKITKKHVYSALKKNKF